MSSGRSEEKNVQLIKRLNRVEGQIRGITNMVKEDRDCLDVMHQLLSASAAIRSIWEIVAAVHLEECMENVGSKEERNKNIEEIIGLMKGLR